MPKFIVMKSVMRTYITEVQAENGGDAILEAREIPPEDWDEDLREPEAEFEAEEVGEVDV